MKKLFKITAFSVWSLFALAGIFLIGGFLAMRFGITNVPGAISFDSQYLVKPEHQVASARQSIEVEAVNRPLLPGPINYSKQHNSAAFYCKLSVLYKNYPKNADDILAVYENTHSLEMANHQFALLGSYMDGATKEAIATCSKNPEVSTTTKKTITKKTEISIPWTQTPQWETFASGIVKEKETIDRVSEETGVSSRLIASMVVSEQMRLFGSNRQAFKNYFAPLGILGTETMFSLGVTGVKSQTALAIENHLSNTKSPFYPGPKYHELITYEPGVNKNTVRIERLSNTKDHYYSYLYAALFIKEIEAQWENAGYDITSHPGILATLWNIGFGNSHPNPDPKIGGSVISLGGRDYTFGSLAYEFYYSGELLGPFPYQEKSNVSPDPDKNTELSRKN